MDIYNFLFHRVSPKRDLLWDPMDVLLFEKCIKYISQKFKVVQFEQFAQSNIKHEMKGKYATIMFDDGYKDNISYALPILEKYKIKASFYLVTDCIENNIPTWTHIIDHTFQCSQKKDIELPFDFLPAELRTQNFIEKTQRIQFARKLKPFLKGISQDERKMVLSEISSQLSDVELPKLMMNWDDARLLVKKGHYVGSHTVSHDMLASIKSIEEIEFELRESRKKIQTELGYAPLTISYPIGSYDDRTISLSSKLGYKFGLAVKQEVFKTKDTNLFEISRIELYNESWFKTRLRINHTLENLKRIIRYK